MLISKATALIFNIFLFIPFFLISSSSMAAGATSINLTPEEHAWLAHNHIVRVRVSDYPPYMLSKPTPSGLSVDYLTEIAKRFGFKVEFLPDTLGWPESIQDVMGSRQHYDLLLTMMPSQERGQQFALSKPYLTAPWVVYTRKDSPYIIGLESLNEKTIAAEIGYVITEKLRSEYPKIRIHEVKNSAEALATVATGVADAYVGNLANSTYLIKMQRLDNLVVSAPTPFGLHEQTMAARKDWPELASLISKGIDSIPPEERNALSQKWGAVEFKPQIDYTLIYWIIAIAGSTVLVTLYWIRRLAKEITVRKQAENALNAANFEISQAKEELEHRILERTNELREANSHLTDELAEHLKAKIALQESEARILAITDSAKDAIIMMDPFGRISYWNPAAEQIFGYTADEARGMDLHRLLAPQRYQQAHEHAYAVFQECGQGEIVQKTIEVEACHKNGHEISVELSLSSLQIQDGWHAIGIVRETTDRKQAERALVESEARFKALHNASFGGIAIHDKGLILECNQGLSNISGYPQEELIGMDGLLLISPSSRQLVRDNIKAGYEKPYEAMGIRKNGEEYPLRLEARNIPYKGKMVRTVEFRDITEYKLIEEALRDSEATVRKKLEVILAPEGDVGELELADINVIPALQAMIEHVYQFTANSGGVAIVDIHGKVLVAVGWQEICTRFHRIHPETKKNCNESDIILSGGIPAGESKAYRCKNNLWDIATPIIIGGKHLGNVFVGQFFYEDEVIDYDLFKQKARQYGFDEEQYLAALDRIPRWNRKSAEAAMSFYGSLAEMISSLSFGTIQQARILSQKDAALHQLEESKTFQASLLETVPVPVFYKDLQGRYLGFNRAFGEFYGKPKGYLVDKSVFDLYPADFAQIYSSRDNELFKQKGTQVYESKIPDYQGHLHDVIFHKATLVDAQGEIVGLIGAMLDITERNRTEEEKKALQKKLLQAYKMEAIGTLAGGIAHDFNNILGAIFGYTEIAKELLPLDSEAIQHLDRVLTASQRASNLVKQILAFSRQSELERIPVKLDHIVDEVLKLIRPSLPVTITINQSVGVAVRSILADPTQVHQILMNLCTNAFHAMEQVGGTLEIKLENCELTAGDLVGRPAIQPGNFVLLTVGDTGTGIDPEVLDKIFDPFFTTKEVGKGTGMGLANCHGIVVGYGGFINCESKLGQGTIFQIFFPAIEEKEFVPAKTIDITPAGTERILLVDDEEVLVEMEKTMLERMGYLVVACSSSMDALAAFQDQPQEFDVVVTDQTMPEMTGVDMARRMLQIRPDIPIILCTGYSSIINEEQAYQYGIKGFVMKPLSKRDLASTLRKVLDQG